MYLLDTNIISELKKPRPHGAVVAWVGSVPEMRLFLSAVTIGEIQAGIEVTRAQDPAKAAQLETWLGGVVGTYRVLPMDAEVFREWARLMHRRSNTLSEDAMIAATARVHGLIVATRNVSDFRGFDVQIVNPFES